MLRLCALILTLALLSCSSQQSLSSDFRKEGGFAFQLLSTAVGYDGSVSDAGVRLVDVNVAMARAKASVSTSTDRKAMINLEEFLTFIKVGDGKDRSRYEVSSCQQELYNYFEPEAPKKMPLGTCFKLMSEDTDRITAINNCEQKQGYSDLLSTAQKEPKKAVAAMNEIYKLEADCTKEVDSKNPMER